MSRTVGGDIKKHDWTLKAETRSRRPAFDREKGVETARLLFHSRGYDAVSIADLTKALEINPPSLYAAYGSKLGLYERALQSYRSTNALLLEEFLQSGLRPAETLTQLMVAAARHYTRSTDERGDMITEAMQADDKQARELAADFARPCAELIRKYIAEHAMEGDVDRIADYIMLNLRGLSSYARLGYSTEKLVDCSLTAGRALDVEFAK